ncbi:glycosyltransferase family 2 protein [Mucilaginibacter sp. OK098]|uniref:glycosyltransferase family 2 protein n=1 Tax=Mucilaginibacter sp. OK098 TaxID=1855297 RepID=UPI0009215A23|nr:glycosyltransferase family A protein [Mucilaginibacter sp. OK098]SHN13308.1 Glycosyltransferase involved in cell wall bisynthesis [Mucilaginibacter sp. OK098]
MDISVIIPLYNSEKSIVEAVDSVAKQTYIAEIEIIVVNDGSTDNSLQALNDYIEKYNIKNVTIINQLNGGAQKARNAGLRIAKGNWIALLDADDYWHPTKMELQMKILNNNPEIDFLGCNRNNEKIKVLFSPKDKFGKIDFKDLFIKTYPQTSTAVFKSNILEDIGLYDESLRYGEDGDYWLRICEKKQMFFMPESLVVTGGGKPNFGFSGMTSKLKEMEQGNLKVLYKNFKLKKLNLFEYLSLRVFYWIKYIRRVLITNFR